MAEDRMRVSLVLKCETADGKVPIENELVQRCMKESDARLVESAMMDAMAKVLDATK